MIYAPSTLINRAAPFTLAQGVVLAEDGQAMVVSMDNTVTSPSFGQQVAKPCTGAAGEIFVGFSNLQTSAIPFDPTTYVRVEQVTSYSDGAGTPHGNFKTVGFPSAASTIFAREFATGAAVAVGTITTTATPQVYDLGAGVGVSPKVYTVTYRYNLSPAQARALAGDRQPGGFVGNYVNVVSIAQGGIIYTNCFDTSQDYAISTPLKLSSTAGYVTATGSGATINAFVKALPTIDYPFLGIQFDAAL